MEILFDFMEISAYIGLKLLTYIVRVTDIVSCINIHDTISVTRTMYVNNFNPIYAEILMKLSSRPGMSCRVMSCGTDAACDPDVANTSTGVGESERAL